jgi:transcriptional regulator with XRE-family HTH domain
MWPQAGEFVTCSSPAMGNPVYEETYALLCALLRAARKNAGFTQIELAEILREPQQYVSRVEKGERRLDVVELCAWCMALDISASEFIKQIDASAAKMARLNEALRGEKAGEKKPEVAEPKKKPTKPKSAKPKR